MTEKSCTGCKHHLGMGLCKINLEQECAAGGGYEAWEPREVRTYTPDEFREAAACGWGGEKKVSAYMTANPKETYTSDDLFALRRCADVDVDEGEHSRGWGVEAWHKTKRYKRYKRDGGE